MPAFIKSESAPNDFGVSSESSELDETGMETELIQRNGTVAIEVDETTRLFTVSDEEDGLGLGLNRHRPTRASPQKQKAYPKELKKTVAALIVMCLNFILTTVSLSIVHEFMPDYQPLPDLVLDHVPYQTWALSASEITIQIQVGLAILILVFHRHR